MLHGVDGLFMYHAYVRTFMYKFYNEITFFALPTARNAIVTRQLVIFLKTPNSYYFILL
jgi:hypothetical protein